MDEEKKYIFITPTIDNMGGAQLYIRNKMLYLKDLGWDVNIITTSTNRNILIPELVPYKDYYWKRLSYNCYEFSQKQVDSTINDIISRIGISKETQIIVESTCMEEATWAEYLSKQIGAKHLFFSLQESNSATNKGMQDFLLFKHGRKEIAGISPKSLVALFESFHPIDFNAAYQLRAYSNNVEADVDSPIIAEIDKSKYDAIVGCLSRLDKDFVLAGIDGLIRYCNNHKSKQVLLLLLGGAPLSIINAILKRLNDIPNIDVKITGYIYPVPTKLLNLCDVFFSSSGSARVCLRSGAPTVAFDANDLKPIGIIGRTTNNSVFRDDNEPPIDFECVLEDILDFNKHTKKHNSYILKVPDYSSHLEFISLSDKSKDYFDIMSITLRTIKEKTRSRIITVFGPDFYTWLRKVKS